MIKTIIEQDSIPEIRAIQRRARDKFMLCDLGGAIEAARGLNIAGLESGINRMQNGTPELTALADKYLAKFEDDIFLGKGYVVSDSVVGAFPNVPALLSGNPYNMRQRRRVKSGQAPLAIFFELTGSAGAMDTRSERGAAMLALVRLLSNTRPVELWTLTTFGETNRMNMIATRVDSTPLDVARAAALLCDIDVLQTLAAISAYTLNNRQGYAGGWSYGIPELERKWSGEALRRVVSPSAELLFIPAAYLNDASLRDPEKWVRDMLQKYGMGAVPRADETDAA